VNCASCNQLNDSSVNFCSKCGANFRVKSISGNQNLSNQTRLRLLVGLALIILLIIFGLKNISIGHQVSNSHLVASIPSSNSANAKCDVADDPHYYYCLVPMIITNTSNVPQQLLGTIYGLDDGKVYEASLDLGSDSINTFSDTLNPGETKSAVIDFKVPANTVLTTVFVSPSGQPTQNGALFSLTVNLKTSDSSAANSASSSSTTSTDSSDSTGILARLNVLNDISWHVDASPDIAANADIVFQGANCLVWAYPDESTMNDAINSGDFSKNRIWHGNDLTSGEWIVLASTNGQSPCAGDVVSALNWTPLS